MGNVEAESKGHEWKIRDKSYQASLRSFSAIA